MLSIYIHSATEPGFLDLPEGQTLEMEGFAGAFQDEEGASEFSLPIDIPWTDNNRRLLGFKERVSNFDHSDNYYKATVYDNGFPELVGAKLTLVSKEGSFGYNSGKFSASISGTRGIFAAAAKSKKLASLPMGGSILFPPGMDSREFAYWHYTTGYTQWPQIRFAPVAWENFYDQQRYDFNGEFLAKGIVNNVVKDGSGGWVFGRPDENNPTVAVGATTVPYKDYRTVPFYTLKFIVEKCFTDLGYSVSGAFFSNTDFDNMVVFNNRSIERYTPIAFTILTSFDENLHIYPADHMPDMLVSDFLKAVLPGLGLFISFVDDKNIVLVYHSSHIKNGSTVNIGDVMAEGFESSFTDGTAKKNGYKISYTADEYDQYYSERVKDTTGKTLLGRYPTRAALDALPANSLDTDEMLYVESENMFYVVADATTFPMKFDAFAEDIGEYINGDGERAVGLPFSTLAQYVVLDAGTGLYTNQGLLGTRQLGSYIYGNRTLVLNPFALRLFYCTPPGNAAVYPVTYNHNRNALNAKTEAYSMALKPADGLSALHTDWQNILQNAEVVKVKLLANKEVMERLRRSSKVLGAGTVFFLKKTERSIPLGETVSLDIVPL